jgi:hypothetical protein
VKIEGNIRSNLISTISAVRRWRGRPVHKDTVNYWHSILEQGRRASTLEQGRRASTHPFGEPTAELVAELEHELAVASQAKLRLP